jgi:hypothetical protein
MIPFNSTSYAAFLFKPKFPLTVLMSIPQGIHAPAVFLLIKSFAPDDFSFFLFPAIFAPVMGPKNKSRVPRGGLRAACIHLA